METEGDAKSKQVKSHPGPRSRIMAAYMAGRLGLPLQLGPQGKHRCGENRDKCGRKLKSEGHGHMDHHERYKKMRQIMKKMKEEGYFEGTAGVLGPVFAFGPAHGPGGQRMGIHSHPGFGPPGMGHPGFGPMSFSCGKHGSPGCEEKWMKRRMMREALRQYMKNKAECDKQKVSTEKDLEDCPEKTQESSGPRHQNGPSHLETGSAEDTPASDPKRPWDRWTTWQQNLQQIYNGDEATPEKRDEMNPDTRSEAAEISQGAPVDASAGVDSQVPTPGEKN